jgi:hypothetical protein
MMNTLAFLLKNRRFLGFGLACTLARNFGQTFFIALFGGTIRAEFQLGHADFGALYATATLISAAAIAAVSGLMILIPARELRQRRSEKFP